MTFDNNYYRKRNRIIRERKALAKKRKRNLQRKSTDAEKSFRKLLDELKIKYIFQHPIYNNWYFCIVDFLIPYKNLIIEIDGGIHNRPDIKKKDARHEKWLRSLGYTIIRLKNEEVYKLTKSKLMKIIN